MMTKPILILRNIPRENPGLIEILLKEYSINDLLDTWINEDPDLQKLKPEQLISDFEKIKTEYQNNGRQIFFNFLVIAGLINSTNT